MGVKALAAVVPGAAGLFASQREYASGAVGGPSHPRLLEPLSNDHLAPGLDHARADEQAGLAKSPIRHAGFVRAEVAELFVDCCSVGLGQLQVGERCEQSVDVSGVELVGPARAQVGDGAGAGASSICITICCWASTTMSRWSVTTSSCTGRYI